MYKWFTALCSEGKPVTGPMIIGRVEPFHYEMKVTDRCTFSGSWLRSNQKKLSRNWVTVGSVR
jgi:hypothetical protein